MSAHKRSNAASYELNVGPSNALDATRTTLGASCNCGRSFHGPAKRANHKGAGAERRSTYTQARCPDTILAAMRL